MGVPSNDFKVISKPIKWEVEHSTIFTEIVSFQESKELNVHYALEVICLRISYKIQELECKWEIFCLSIAEIFFRGGVEALQLDHYKN